MPGSGKIINLLASNQNTFLKHTDRCFPPTDIYRLIISCLLQRIFSWVKLLTSYSATLIENIFTNNLSQNVFNGVVLNDLSDHLPVFAYFTGLTLTCDGENKAFIRKFTDENLRKFSENVSNTNWSSLLNENPNIAYNNFIDEYSRIYNACFPLKAIKGKLLNNCSSP